MSCGKTLLARIFLWIVMVDFFQQRIEGHAFHGAVMFRRSGGAFAADGGIIAEGAGAVAVLIAKGRGLNVPGVHFFGQLGSA